MKELELKALMMDLGSDSPFILLQDRATKKVIPIWIGIYEAVAISYELQGEDFSRPMTYDLIQNTLFKLKSGLETVVINKLENHTYYASLFIRESSGPGIKEIDVRPSDSIILALKADAPIYITDKVFEAGAIELSRDKKDYKEFVEKEMSIRNFRKSIEDD